MDKQLSKELIKRENIDFFSLGMDFLPDPDPVLRKLGRDITVYKALKTDGHIRACVSSRKAGILSKEWAIDKGKAKTRQVKFIEELFNDIDVYTLISDILESPFFGYQPIEIVWEVKGNYRLPVKIEAKPPEWFQFDGLNQLRFKQNGSTEGVLLPKKKILLPRYNASYDNPYGDRVFSSCFWSATFKKGGIKFWSIFTEKYGMPFVIGKLPQNQMDELGLELKTNLEKMVQDGVAVIDENGSIEIIEPTGKSASADIYNKLIDFCNSEISKAIIGQTLTTEIGKNGSYAASQTHQEVRQDIIDGDKHLVITTINQLIKWICELNFSFSETPKFTLFEEEDVKKEQSERDKILSETGVKFTKKYFVKNYNLKEEDFEIIENQQKPTPSEFAETKTKKDEDIIETLSNIYSDKDKQKQMEEVLQPIFKIINESNNYDEALDKLADVYPDMNTNDLIKKMEKVYYLSDILGHIDAN